MERPSLILSRVRALRQLDPVLSQLVMDGGTEAEYLAKALLDCGAAGEDRQASEAVRQVLDAEAGPFDSLKVLALDLVGFSEGIPECKDRPVWHAMGFMLDTDLLVAARLALERNPPEVTEAVADLAWPSVLGSDHFAIEQVIRRPLADTHVHLGGALPGSFYWLAAMCDLARLQRTTSWYPADSDRWPGHIRKAQGIRQHLVCWLFGILPPAAGASLNTAEDVEPFVDPVLRLLLPDKKSRCNFSPALGERYLLWRAMAEVFFRPDDGTFCSICLEYLRIRNSFIRFLTHTPGTRGLGRFLETFRRKSSIFPSRANLKQNKRKRRRDRRIILVLERFRVRHALRYQFSDPTDAPWARDQGAGLPGYNPESWPAGRAEEEKRPAYTAIPPTPWRPARQIELRVSPSGNPAQALILHAYLLGLADFIKHDRDAPLLRAGFVFHVLRSSDLKAFQNNAKWQFEGLLALLDDLPQFRPFVVGIDVAGNEIDTAPREVAGIFLGIRNKVDTQPLRPGGMPVHIRRTIHAGEDFRDLLTGLRYIDESVALLDLRPGERIGHGLALALDPARWYQQNRRSLPKLRDHILDLLWGRCLALKNTRRPELAPDRELDALLVNQLEKCEKWLKFDLVRSSETILPVFFDLARFPSEAAILEVLFPEIPANNIEIEASGDWINLVSALRSRVMKRVEAAEIVIETAPTSNLLIGNLTAYENLPYLNLNPIHYNPEKNEPRIALSINSDDPGIFQTTIAHEFRMLGEALLNRGYHREDVVSWLEKVRNTGLASSFIPPWSPPTRDEILYRVDQAENGF